VTSPSVEILLATRNGERFLPDLVESLHAQTFRDLRILARDDSSTDATAQILREQAEAHSDRFDVLEDADGSLGASGNFSRLISASSAPYVMFCDQDDRWRPEKVAVTLEAMRIAEARHGTDTPILVHTDLQVADVDLRELGTSFWRYQRLRPELGERFERVLVQNAVTGCATMVNRSLLVLAEPVPEEAVMHDWWVALVAAAFGVVVAVPQATVAYRQHGENQVGAVGRSPGYLLGRAIGPSSLSDFRESLRRSVTQAKAFQDRFGHKLTESQQKALATYVSLDGLSFSARRGALIRHRLLRHGLIRNLALLLRV